MLCFEVDKLRVEEYISPIMSMIPWVTFAAAAAVADYTNPIVMPGEPGYEPPVHHLRVMFENDSFIGEDNGYTHGSRIDYARAFCGNHCFCGDGWAWGLSLTQNIYSPDTKTQGNVMGEHPYAGYLALGGALLHKAENFGWSAELQLGTTGKPSLAENAQYAVHAVGDMEQWRGWADQVPAEPTMQLTLRQDWRVPCLEHRFRNHCETDGTLFTRENLGTVNLGAAVGLTLRYGRNLPDSMQVNGSEAGNFGMGLLDKPDYHPEQLAWFLYAQGQLRFVGRDMFIDGGVFHRFDQTCSRKPWIAELQVGAAAAYRGIDYYLGIVWSSRTYRTESTNPMYGTCGITWHW